MSTLNTCTSSTRPASPAAGDTLFETDTNKIITYDGTDWRLYVSDGSITPDDGELYYEGTLFGRYGGFEPLDDFGTPNAGCTMIKINGKWL